MEIYIICLIFVSIVIFIFFKLQNNKLQDLKLDLQKKNQEQEDKIANYEDRIQQLANFAGRYEQSEIILQDLKTDNKNLTIKINDLKDQ